MLRWIVIRKTCGAELIEILEVGLKRSCQGSGVVPSVTGKTMFSWSRVSVDMNVLSGLHLQ